MSLRMAFPREKRENEEFDDEEFLTRKTNDKYEELTTLKSRILGNIKRKFCFKSLISKKIGT